MLDMEFLRCSQRIKDAKAIIDPPFFEALPVSKDVIALPDVLPYIALSPRLRSKSQNCSVPGMCACRGTTGIDSLACQPRIRKNLPRRLQRAD
jgi:hypothetical protein